MITYDTFAVRTICLNNQSLHFSTVLKLLSLGTKLNINILKHIKIDFTSQSVTPKFTQHNEGLRQALSMNIVNEWVNK